MKKLLAIIGALIWTSVHAQQQLELCLGETLHTYTVSANTSGSFTWSLDRNVVSYNNEITVDWSNYEIGTYILEVGFMSDAGCTAEPVQYVVTTTQCPISMVWTPNAFTANGDMINPSWSPVGFNVQSLEFAIFNRWGERIHISNGTGWDGTYRGTPCQDGVYVYLLKWVSDEGKNYEKVGKVTLLGR